VQTADASGAIGTATFTVRVTGANDAPVTTDDVASIVGNARSVSGDLLANDTDAENNVLFVSNVIHDNSTPSQITVDGTFGEIVVTRRPAL